MYKGLNDINIFEGDVVVDPYDRLWFVESFTQATTHNETKANCKNGASVCTWPVSSLVGVIYKEGVNYVK